MKQRIFALLTCLLLALAPAVGMGEQADEVNDLLQGILDFKAAQAGADTAADWIASSLPEAMGSGGEWYAIALSQTGSYDLSGCAAALQAYTESKAVRSATTRQKLALTLLALGHETDFVTATLADSIGQQGVMSLAWGLHLLNNGCESPTCSAEEIIKMLLDLRKEDGGWAITGSTSDVDATAMVLQSLAPHRENPDVAAAIEAAVTLLSSRQLDSGGFASYGVENAESTAQVIIALCALDIDPFADSRFIKAGVTLLDALTSFQLANGSFAHETDGAYNESATAQVFLALAACQRHQAGGGSLYLLNREASRHEAKSAPGYQPIAAAIIGGGALIACVALLLTGKRHPKNFLAVLLIAVALIVLVYTVEIESAADYYAPAAEKADVIGQVTLTIRCDRVAGQASHIPEDGVILAQSSFPLAAGDTVYTILTDAARAHGIHMEASGANGLMYVHGIGNIYEFDFGDLSGWVYLVNGESASVGCDQYTPQSGDHIEWHYTLEMGRDID